MCVQLQNAPQVKQQKNKRRFDPKRLNRGIVLVKNLPKGFYEEQLRKYFAQYGRVTRLRLARSLRTGNSKHYAYIEFAFPEVAKIAADTMNNYIMFRQIIKTAYIPPEQQDHDYFRQPVQQKKIGGIVRHITPSQKRVLAAKKAQSKPITDEQHVDRVERSCYKWVLQPFFFQWI